MKKVFLLMAAVCMTAAANATILRVSNVTGSSAPYTSIADAHDAAIPGDTIMVEGSADNYGYQITISKKIVLIGPGYNHIANGGVNEGSHSAKIQILRIDYKEVVVEGMEIQTYIDVNKPNVVLTRCLFDGGVNLSSEASGTVIHQNYLKDGIYGGSSNSTSNVSITNNIFECAEAYNGRIKNLKDSHIAYNTCLKEAGTQDNYNDFFRSNTGCTIENNILCLPYTSNETNVYTNNYTFDETPFYNIASEVAIRNTELGFSEGKYGAFSGDDPYVISGIPAGAVIEDITVPASVEKGKKLNVTIKLGLQK